MIFQSDNIVILTRTTMANGVCVGAYDVANQRMIRLLDSKAGRLAADAPYQVMQVYSLRYAERYALTAPHTEDVAVYEHNLISIYSPSEFRELISHLSNGRKSLCDLFMGRLKWEQSGSGYIIADEVPNYSVEIISTSKITIKSTPYYKEFGTNRRAKYVGARPIESLPSIINAGAFVRFSLTRPWNRGDGVFKLYLQLSAVY